MEDSILNKINIEFKTMLYNAMEDASYRYKEFKAENPFSATHNCYAAARWDSINEVMSYYFLENDIPFSIVRRGFWSLLLFCNPEQNTLFSVMRVDRFNEICNNPESNAPKYFDSLVSLNYDLEAKASQTTLTGKPYEANDKNKQLDILCGALPKPNDNKYTHVIVLFDVSYDDITSIKLCIVNNRFEIVDEVDVTAAVIKSRIPEEIPEVEKPSNESTSQDAQRGFVKLKNSSIEAV